MEELCVEGGTLRNLLESKDLLALQPRVKMARKDDKEFSDAYSDAAAAFLGPNIWDKTLSDFKLEYLDLDELVGQNIASEVSSKVHHNAAAQSVDNVSNLLQLVAPQDHAAAAQMDFRGIDSNPNSHPMMHQPTTVTPPMSPIRLASCMQAEKKNMHSFSRDCDFSNNEISLATPPGDDTFDPANDPLHDEDLKPQPIVRKSEKHFVPDSLKDDRYWARRRKNNLAAKRSREARRVKENQIVLRASYLEKENSSLKEDVMRLKSENNMLRNQLRKLSSSFPI